MFVVELEIILCEDAFPITLWLSHLRVWIFPRLPWQLGPPRGLGCWCITMLCLVWRGSCFVEQLLHLWLISESVWYPSHMICLMWRMCWWSGQQKLRFSQLGSHLLIQSACPGEVLVPCGFGGENTCVVFYILYLVDKETQSSISPSLYICVINVWTSSLCFSMRLVSTGW